MMRHVFCLFIFASLIISCAQPKPPLKFKVLGVFGLVEKVSTDGTATVVTKGQELQAGDIIRTGRNSLFDLALDKGKLRMFSNGRLLLANHTDYDKKEYPLFRLNQGQMLVRYKRKKGLGYVFSNQALIFKSRKLRFRFKVSASKKADLLVAKGNAMVRPNYVALRGASQELIDSSLVLTDLDNGVRIGESLGKYQRIKLSGNLIRVYNQQITQMVKAAQLAKSTLGRSIKPSDTDRYIRGRLNLGQRFNAADYYDLKVKSYKKKSKKIKKLKKQLKSLKKKINLTDIRRKIQV